MDEEFDKMFGKLLVQATIIEEQWRRRLNKQKQTSKRKSSVTKDDNLAKKAKLDDTAVEDCGYESEVDYRILNIQDKKDF